MNGTDITFEFKGSFRIAPINQHIVLERLTTILKALAELQNIDCNNGELVNNLSIIYTPIGKK